MHTLVKNGRHPYYGGMFVLSLGGSIVAPDSIDTGFISQFRELIFSYLESRPSERMILVIGGGAPARSYQQACRTLDRNATEEALDWIGIMATRLNAELVRHALSPRCVDPVVIDPEGPIVFTGQILAAAGWKPGFSTDFDAVYLAERFGADTVVNLSNVDRVYSADPKIDPDAKPLTRIRWAEFQKIVGHTWKAGTNVPFDPIATQKSADIGLRVIAAGGRDLKNLSAILNGRPFSGTTIGPD